MLGVDKLAKVLLQSESKENQNCPGLTLVRFVLVIQAIMYIFVYMTFLACLGIWQLAR